MKLITQAELAAKLGITRQSIRDVRLRGHLDMVGKKVDLDGRATKDYLSEALERKKCRETDKTYKKPVGKRRTATRDDSSVEPIDDTKLENLDKNSLERVKMIEGIHATRVKTAEARNELIERKTLMAYVAKQYSVETAELQPLGGKISADLASIFGDDTPESKIKAQEAIDKEVYGALQHKKRIMDDFVKNKLGK